MQEPSLHKKKFADYYIINKSDLNSNVDNIDIKFKNKFVKTTALTKEGTKALKNYLEKLVDKNFSDIIFYIPTDSSKISSWIYNNSLVYNDTFCDINFIGNKIKTKISIKKQRILLTYKDFYKK